MHLLNAFTHVALHIKALKSKGKQWMSLGSDIVSEWNDLSIAKSAMFDFESIATRLVIMESSNRDPFIAPFTQ